MENTITATDVRYRFPELVKRVQQGESFIAIAHSRPIFRIVPLEQPGQLPAASDWLARVEASPARATPSLKEINALVHSIRRRGKQ